MFTLYILALFAIALIGATMISKAILTKVTKASALVVGFLIFIASIIAIIFSYYYILGIMGLNFAR